MTVAVEVDNRSGVEVDEGAAAELARRVLAAEGEPHGIRANAISPAAATRMLRREVAPGELEPEQVSPAVVFLSSERCTFSGKVLECSGGRFSVARWTSSEVVDLGREPVDAGVIEERWAEIEGASP